MAVRESWLGVDYGTKRIGLAHADDIRVPVPLPAAVGGDEDSRLEEIGRLITAKNVQEIVLGHPTRPDGSSGEMAQVIEGFRDRLATRFGLPIHLVDERNSSQEAGEHWNLKKARQKRKSGQLDSAAATLILREYLDQITPIEDQLLLDPESENCDPLPHA